MTPEQAFARAEAVGWLSRQPARFRERLLQRCKLRSYQPGDPLYKLDDPPDGIYGLVEGFVDVLLAAGPNPPFLVYIGRTGWWVGEAAALTGTPRRVEVRARTPAQALFLPPTGLADLTREDPAVWKCFAALSVSHMDNALMLAATLAPGSTRSKVMTTLLRLAGAYSTADAVIDLPCKQSEIAELSGLTRNSIGPVIKALVKDGLVVSSRSRLAYNPARLRQSLGL